ncbi:MAG TPA: hypothetical protein VLJ86_00300 [Ramlibacter sp.]|nr:hypothetical protein [Ramlibacter sp.]
MNKLAPTVALLALLTGCSTTSTVTPQYDTRFGDAVKQARLAQTINPAGATAPTEGMDGKAANESLVRYQHTFKTPPPVVNVINIGGQVGTGR